MAESWLELGHQIVSVLITTVMIVTRMRCKGKCGRRAPWTDQLLTLSLRCNYNRLTSATPWPRRSQRMVGVDMEGIDVLRANLADAHWFLEGTIEGLGAEQVHWAPPGTANTIGATYAHVIGSEDAIVQSTLQGRPLLADSEWARRNGISLPIPQRGSDWFSWSRRVQVDLSATRRYAEAVYTATDAYLATVTSDQLDRAPEVAVPGNQSLRWLLHNLIILHAGLHTGEIAVLKGLQGLQGYP
jgi:hypothetical protein